MLGSSLTPSDFLSGADNPPQCHAASVPKLLRQHVKLFVRQLSIVLL